MTPDRLLTWYAAEAARAGYTCPSLDSAQARQVAEVALLKLGSAAGLMRPEPVREPAALTAGPAVDGATQLLPLYAAGRSGL